MKPSRKQMYFWKTGKALPRPTTLKSIKDEKIREEAALYAIKQYVPFIKTKKKLLEALK